MLGLLVFLGRSLRTPALCLVISVLTLNNPLRSCETCETNLSRSGCAAGNRHYVSNCSQPEVVCNTSKLSRTYLPVRAKEHNLLVSDPEGKHSGLTLGTGHIHYNGLRFSVHRLCLALTLEVAHQSIPPRSLLLCHLREVGKFLCNQHNRKPGFRKKLYRR